MFLSASLTSIHVSHAYSILPNMLVFEVDTTNNSEVKCLSSVEVDCSLYFLRQYLTVSPVVEPLIEKLASSI